MNYFELTDEQRAAYDTGLRDGEIGRGQENRETCPVLWAYLIGYAAGTDYVSPVPANEDGRFEPYATFDEQL